MSEFFYDPDGNWKPPVAPDFTNNFYYPIKFKGSGRVTLRLTVDAAWEQAVTILLNEVRQKEQLGSYHRPKSLSFDVAEGDMIRLVGWHKKGTAHDPSVPWSPSLRRDFCPTWKGNKLQFSWEDSGDMDFNDCVVIMDVPVPWDLA